MNQAIGGPFYWTQGGSVVLLRDSSGNPLGDSSEATGVSGNGPVIVGGNALPGGQAFRWVNGVAAPLAQLASSTTSIANSISEDGSIIAGDVHSGSNFSGFTLNGTTLTYIPPASMLLTTTGTIMSANGNVIAGSIEGGSGSLTAFQWKNGALVNWPGSTVLSSSAKEVSPDGSVVIGWQGVGDQGNTVPFEWTGGVATSFTLPSSFINGSALGA
jgi:uncharacterized membrane protein